jgi:hypothetical protein
MPGPGWRKCTAYRQTGPGGPPLVLRLSEGLGRTRNEAESLEVLANVNAVAVGVG